MHRVFLICLTSVICLLPASSFAYIGPGAGFAVAGSFLVMFTAILSGLVILLTWPIRYIIRTIRFRRVHARGRVKKVIVLGLDGMDYTLTERWIKQGKLPHFAKLRDKGCLKPLASTVPPMSPVAWSSFQTGSNPGKHNIFDFLTRDRKTYGAKLSSSAISDSPKRLNLGKYSIPFGGADIRLLRKGVPFWKTLGDHGIFSSIIRVPITFPPEKHHGLQLSGMCVPDLRGSQGMFSYYSTDYDQQGENTGGERLPIHGNGKTLKGELIGPENPMLKESAPLKCPFIVTIRDANNADIKVNGEIYPLRRGVYSDWIKIEFKASLGLKISGICRFLLKKADHDFELYVSPINMDPEKPAMPISHPKVFSAYLSKRQGPYATLGLIEDSWALNEKFISDDDFFQQCLDADMEREKMFFDSLGNIKHGLCVCVFDGTDRVQHAFWREMDENHPAHEGNYKKPDNPAIEQIYKRADALLGRTMEACNDDDTLLMVISDHGFNAFSRGVDLNRWLEENGYLKLKKDGRNKKNLSGIDWSKTRAFSLGLSGIFLNLKGREAQGIVDPKSEAPKLRDEIAQKLGGLKDPLKDKPAIKHIYNARKIYRGPYKDDAPDLIVGYQVGYRASWETAIGQVTDNVFHDNKKAWSGDHCMDQSLVPGVLFCNRRISDESPRLIDLGPTVLNMFGVEVPSYMDGRPLSLVGSGRDSEK